VKAVQTMLVGAVLLVVGLVVGGLGPRQEARQLRKALEAAPEACTDDGNLARGIASVFSGRPLGGQLPQPGSPAADAPAATEDLSTAEGAPGEVVSEGDEPEARAPDIDPDEAVRIATQAMAMRRAQARAALEEAGATEEQLAKVDAAVTAMNTELLSIAEEFVTGMEDGAEPDRHDMMVFASETLEVLLTADETLSGTFDPEVRAALDEAALDPFSYIDGPLVEQLVRLQEN
jgi:hypothetical protein